MQDSVSNLPVQGYNGMLVDARNSIVETGIASTNAIPFGVFVVADDADSGAPEGLGGALREQLVRLPEATAEITSGVGRGISLADTMESGATAPAVAIGDALPVLRQGKAWVISEDAVALGGDVWVRHSGAGAGRMAGADGATHTVAPGLKWGSTRADSGLAIVEINMP